MKKSVLAIAFVSIVALIIAAACSSKTASNVSIPTGKTIKSVAVGNLTATLSNSTGKLKPGDQEVMLAFTDSSGKPIDVGAVSLNFHMAQMGTMAEMNNTTAFTTTGTPGVSPAQVNPKG